MPPLAPNMRPIYALNATITIPAGTKVTIDENRRTEYAGQWVSVLIPHGKDHTSEWLMPLDDAIERGLVRVTGSA